MNTFAQIKRIAEYEKVIYYSICLDDDEASLFEEFIRKHGTENRNKLNHILVWIKTIGDKYGAQERHFRPEGEFADTSALPPPSNNELSFIEYGKKKSNNLRLYCLRANESVVFLFNGDIKTEQKAQDCPNVRKHFKLANYLTKAIDQAFIDQEITWNEEYTNITYDKSLKIYF